MVVVSGEDINTIEGLEEVILSTLNEIKSGVIDKSQYEKNNSLIDLIKKRGSGESDEDSEEVKVVKNLAIKLGVQLSGLLVDLMIMLSNRDQVARLFQIFRCSLESRLFQIFRCSLESIEADGNYIVIGNQQFEEITLYVEILRDLIKDISIEFSGKMDSILNEGMQLLANCLKFQEEFSNMAPEDSELESNLGNEEVKKQHRDIEKIVKQYLASSAKDVDDNFQKLEKRLQDYNENRELVEEIERLMEEAE
ncbi:hypothetical protein QYF36_014309 [Acer negundo]|nr:hypothetical protein QYF36_014309 [Acer negundo]